MQIKWNPPAEAEAIDSIFSLLDGEELAADDPLVQMAPPVPPPAQPGNKNAENS